MVLSFIMASSENKDLEPNDLPDIGDIGIHWSKTKIVLTFFTCLLLSTAGIFGFLLYQEYGRKPLLNQPETAVKNSVYFKNYSNDYWGFKFQYPATWSQVIGSYQEGDYYFASQPINFISELESGQMLLEVQT